MSNSKALQTTGAPKSVAHLSGGQPTAIVPQSIDDVYRMAQLVANSGLAPRDMNTPEKISISIFTGLELGVKPMQAIQGIAVINGRPCVWGDLALAIVRVQPEFEWIKEEFVGEEPADWSAAKPSAADRKFKARCTVKRKGQPEVVNEYSIADAVLAKLWQKKGGYNGDKDTPWVTNPKRMLKMRARGFSLRDLFTDALKGMRLAEEMIGSEDNDNEQLGAPPPPAEVVAHTAQAIEHQAQVGGPQPPEQADVTGQETTAQAQPAAPEVVEEAVVTEGDGEQDEDEFNGDAWLLETAGPAFERTKNSDDVDRVHEMFGDTAEGELDMEQRQRYEALHAAALARFTVAPPEDDAPPPADDDAPAPEPEPTPTPEQAYDARLSRALDEARCREDVAQFWNGTKEDRVGLDDGYRKNAHAAMTKAFNEKPKRSDAAPAADPKPADKPKPGGKAKPAEQAKGDGEELSASAAFTDQFRERIEQIEDVNELLAYMAETLPERNKIANGDRTLLTMWQTMQNQRRNAILGI